MKMYCGIDLHSNNSVVALQNKALEDVTWRRIGNDLEKILRFLEPYREDIARVAVESTYNWYWLVDGLTDAGYKVALMNTTKASKYSDMKYTDDKHDARWIAHLLALGILPEGYIVPREERGVRDLLRRRSFLVQKKTDHLLSLQTVFSRNTGKQISTTKIEKWTLDGLQSLIDNTVVVESMLLVLPVVGVLTKQIKQTEKRVLELGSLRDEFKILQTAPGIGEILALTIMCETADIARFPKVGNYVSYCRCAKTEHTSNNKKKGTGNRKNGNRFLSWAYSEAAHHMKRYDLRAQRYYDRKRSRCHPMVAKRALAAKIARACYFVLRNQESFDSSRTFCK